ncbi:MAG: DUF2442 domain-containing protein [Cyclobacteriaceae bacterium]
MEVQKVWIDNKNIYHLTDKGKKKYLPISQYKRLAKASQKQRESFEVSPFGIHWEEIDEDLSFAGTWYEE